MPDIRWKIHLRSSPVLVFSVLNSAEGRARFWAESAQETEGFIHFKFSNGEEYKGAILEVTPCTRFELRYFDSLVRFELQDDGQGGTDLQLTNYGVPDSEYPEVKAGWVSVLLALKAACDFQIDIRNHDPNRTWDQGYADN